MIVVIAPEQDVDNEIDILHRLFDDGLMAYHFRKPHKNYEEHKAYLNQIDDKYHHKIVVHYFHELVNDFDLKGIHLQEQFRIDKGNDLESYIRSFRGKENKKDSITENISISSSFHEPEVLDNCKTKFDYHLLSPVFSSISKEGYNGRGFDVNHIKKNIVGMGGVNSETIPELFKLGYSGIGVLGGVWNTDAPVKSFKQIKEQYELEHSFRFKKG